MDEFNLDEFNMDEFNLDEFNLDEFNLDEFNLDEFKLFKSKQRGQIKSNFILSLCQLYRKVDKDRKKRNLNNKRHKNVQ